MTGLALERLQRAVRQDAAIRRVQRLQPAGGQGDKVFPPTYPGDQGPVHVRETRRIGGNDVECVLLDSVQSQANRLEEALLGAMWAGRLSVPHVLVDFTGQKYVLDEGVEYDLSDIGRAGKITSLDAPHRIFDAIIRDSDLNGERFTKTSLYAGLVAAKPSNATAVFALCPASLLFGAWNSHGEGGGLGAKFARCIVSEIVGIEAREGTRAAVRIDPLGASKDVRVVGTRMDWRVAQPREKGAVRPSEIGHSNVPASQSKGGVTIDYAIHTSVISCSGLRRIGFGDRDASAGRAVLAALGLAALTLQDESGYALRSRCDLVRESPAPFEILHADGSSEQLEIDAAGAISLYSEAVAAAKSAGLPWRDQPVVLTPQRRLVELVARSRAKALAGEAEKEEATT